MPQQQTDTHNSHLTLPSVVLWHHHTNFKHITHPDVSSPVRTVALMGHYKNIAVDDAWLDTVRAGCKELGIELKLVDYTKAPPADVATDPYKQEPFVSFVAGCSTSCFACLCLVL